MRLFWLTAVALFLAVAASPADAWSASGARVAIIGASADAPLTRQLRVELAGLGFEAVPIESAGEIDASDALQLMRNDNLIAIIRTWPDKARVEVWVSDTDTGALSTRGMNPTRPDATPRVIALRAIELLRASLRELEAKKSAPPEPPPAAPVNPIVDAGVVPPPRPPAEPPRLPRWIVGVGGAVIGSPGGVGTAVGVEPNMQVWPVENFGFSAMAILPVSGPRVSKREGSATIGIFLAGLGPSVRLRLPRGWYLQGSVGGGAALLRTSGSAAAPFTGKADVATSATAYGCVSTAYRLTPELAIEAGLLVGSLVSAAEIRFAGQSVAKWGVPYGAGTLAMSLRLR